MTAVLRGTQNPAYRFSHYSRRSFRRKNTLTYLVTGGAGFIGSALPHELLERGEHVRVLDNLATGNKRNLADVINRVEFVEADICDLPAVEQAMQGVDYVLHQAALPSVPRSVEDPLLSHRNNADGTINVLWADRKSKVKRLVYAASSSAYGDTPTLPQEEAMIPNRSEERRVGKEC